MAKTVKLKSDDRTITVRVPISIRKRGGRKVMLAPDGTSGGAMLSPRIDNAMVKAIARAFRWRDMLESGRHVTIKEIACNEAINDSYVARVLRLTLLAPEIVDSILCGDHPAAITLATLMRPFPIIWVDQISKTSKQSL